MSLPQLDWSALDPNWYAMAQDDVIVVSILMPLLLATIFSGMVKKGNTFIATFFLIATSLFIGNLAQMDAAPFLEMTSSALIVISICTMMYLPIAILINKFQKV
jgi:hypothetical protein